MHVNHALMSTSHYSKHNKYVMVSKRLLLKIINQNENDKDRVGLS